MSVRCGDRVLTEARCVECGGMFSVFVIPGEVFACGDCSPWLDREVNGWTPENSGD